MPTVTRDVPQEVVDLANIIAWEKIPESKQRQRIGELEQFIQGRLNVKDPYKDYPGAGGQRVRRAVPQWVLDILSKYDYSSYNSPFMRRLMKTGAIAYLKAHNIPLIED